MFLCGGQLLVHKSSSTYAPSSLRRTRVEKWNPVDLMCCWPLRERASVFYFFFFFHIFTHSNTIRRRRPRPRRLRRRPQGYVYYARIMCPTSAAEGVSNSWKVSVRRSVSLSLTHSLTLSLSLSPLSHSFPEAKIIIKRNTYYPVYFSGSRSTRKRCKRSYARPSAYGLAVVRYSCWLRLVIINVPSSFRWHSIN
jgi:hypothetical protein